MKVWEIQNAYGIDNLAEADKPEPKPGAGEIVVAMKAASLNYRDLLTVIGYGGGYPLPLIPFSDGAGVVEAVGAGVTRVAAGDRVCPLFFQSWLAGPVTAAARNRPLGGPLSGVLQQKMLLEADGVAKFPAHLSFAEAATLPCAGLTAWRAVTVEAPVGPGDTVLVQGTGGVSIFALQFAKARGATVIATSSSDAKLARAKALGADHLINYKTTPDWGRVAREMTGGRGVDVVVEVGGENTLNQSFDAARVGGHIVVIGVLGGFSSPVTIPIVFGKNLHIHGISVGSREQFDDMAAHIAKWKLTPVVDKVFAWGRLREALKLMQAGGHFGKIVVEI
ncbi:MAG TPA: NAD(P)-dependent alcohol dehydrogenase [Rhizomicrobium sp.]|jgi:NADPH:quinone reductase-like Zn-dependent oxidoreductase|nr:NAD(P)-dependent alcohol dehydrogenase [Rhizomicrobium sp.]